MPHLQQQEQPLQPQPQNAAPGASRRGTGRDHRALEVEAQAHVLVVVEAAGAVLVRRGQRDKGEVTCSLFVHFRALGVQSSISVLIVSFRSSLSIEIRNH